MFSLPPTLALWTRRLHAPVPATTFQAVIAGLMAILTLWLGYFTPRNHFTSLIILYGLLFGLYIVAIKNGRTDNLRFYTHLGIWLRWLLLFSVPALSDDVYRFIWDGYLLLAGQNPLVYTPAQIMETQASIPGITVSLFSMLNSKDHFTVYPPIAQVVFVASCALSFKSVWGATIVMRLILLVAEMGVIRLLPRVLDRMGLPAYRSLIYVLNPLIILEISGNLHFEGLMIYFLLLSMLLLLDGRYKLAGVGMAISVATKLLPLLFLPFLLRRLSFRQSLAFFVPLGLALGILFIPFLGGVRTAHFGESLQLYFKQFEFNAAIFNVARWIARMRTGYSQVNIIGPTLALATTTVILLAALWEHHKDLRRWPGMSLYAITVYLLFTSTIHPWYLALPIVLCVFTNRRYPVVWSGLVFLSYSHYSFRPYQEHWGVIGLEYGLLAIFWITEALLWNKKCV